MYIDYDVWYAPTSGFIEWECPECNEVVDLEKYSGINAEGCATTKYGVKAVKRLKKEIKKIKKK
jgi:hypothetical protein